MYALCDENVHSWTAFDRILRVIGGAGSLGGGLSSSVGYPWQALPKFVHLRHEGLVSSHFIWRFL